MASITFTDADGVERTLDTEQRINSAYHADCLEILRAMPDKCIDLIVADPPYGDGNTDNDTEHRNQRGRFDRYNDSSQIVKVERERSKEDSSDSMGAESETRGRSTSRQKQHYVNLWGDTVSTSTGAVARTGGTWAEKYGKKS